MTSATEINPRTQIGEIAGTATAGAEDSAASLDALIAEVRSGKRLGPARLTRRAAVFDSRYTLGLMRTHPRRRPLQGSTGMRKRWVVVMSLSSLGLASILIAVAVLTVGAQEDGSRLIAIGDIHGAATSVRAVLQHTGLIDQQDHGTGGRSTLVQTGDYTDRGPDVLAVMDLLMRLEDEADEAGGRVEVLLGNHETMSLTAEVRDVTPLIFASFADERSAQRREEA